MTTIAANRDMMAADSKVSDDDTSYSTDKIFILDGYIVGAVGTVEETNRFLKWFKEGRKDDGPEFVKDSGFCALALGPTGLYYFGGCCPPDLVIDPFHAIGGGAMSALTALTLGHDPEKSVTIACQIHNGSGLPVKVLRLTDIPKVRKRRG